MALMGFDQVTAEVLINLLTGATLPDRGDVRVFGQLTSEITNGEDWLALADRFGIVSERAVLLEGLSVVQNLAMPFSLEIEPPAPEVEAQALRLADDTGVPESDWTRPVATLSPLGHARVRLGRSLALQPEILLVEHPSVGLPREDGAVFARQIREVARRRDLAVVSITADPAFADHVASRVLTLEPGSGRLSERRRSWLRR